MKTLISLAIMAGLTAALPACSSLPSMQYCDQVQYTRAGNLIHLQAECRAPVGTSISTP